jgi:membrane associated rhomboid family serine protease
MICLKRQPQRFVETYYSPDAAPSYVRSWNRSYPGAQGSSIASHLGCGFGVFYPWATVFIPIQHENMSARRWPVITFGLILLNLAIFLATHWVIEKQDSQLWDVRLHIAILAARHAELVVTPQVGEWLNDFKNQDADDWAKFQQPDSEVFDDWDRQTRQIDDPELLQAEMDSLADQHARLMATSILQRFGFVPAHPTLISYVSSNFLHGGWWHIIGNMWFLWLAGFVLEDAWGRRLYLLVYLLAGVVSCQFDAWANPGSLGTSIGASGAVAGLMGGFLVRFPKMKIRMATIFDLGLHAELGIWIRAYWLLPLWLLMEISDGMGPRDGIGHWAHVGGFVFGGIAAVALRRSGLEQKANRALEQEVSWEPPSEITEASKLMDGKQFDDAITLLKQYLAHTPESFDGWGLLRVLYWRKGDVALCREVSLKLCELHLKQKEYAAAWHDYQEFLAYSGEGVPSFIAVDLCRAAEEQGLFEWAVNEYEKFAVTYPQELQSVHAQVRAARLYLHKLDRPQDASRLYRAASASAVPHLDLEPELQSGIREAAAALSESEGASAAAGSAAS